ncbi:MAG: alpha/beta fold hydrolase [bacterium]
MQDNKMSVNGLELSYIQQGNHENTLVFLHGNSACKEVFEKQYAYFSTLPVSILALDLPGHGGSANADDPEATYTIPAYARLIESFLEQKAVKNHILVGWSLGGNIALEMAGNDLIKHNKHMKGACVFGAPPAGPGMEQLMAGFLPAVFDTAVAEEMAPEEQLQQFVEAIYGTLSPIPQKFIDCAMRTDGKAREQMVTHWMTGTDGHDQPTTVAKWKKPICVIHGSLDPFVSFDYMKNTHWNKLWNKKIYEFKECGHAPFLENPDPFNELLEEFSKQIF